MYTFLVIIYKSNGDEEHLLFRSTTDLLKWIDKQATWVAEINATAVALKFTVHEVGKTLVDWS